jgi:hypothetical protein
MLATIVGAVTVPSTTGGDAVLTATSEPVTSMSAAALVMTRSR